MRAYQRPPAPRPPLPPRFPPPPASPVARNATFLDLAGGASCLLIVPSVIVPEELNVLISPNHKDHARVKATKVRRWLYDPRLGA